MAASYLIGLILVCALVGQAWGCLQARVLGAGVVGLTTAIQLQKLGFNVTIHAYASPLQNSEYVYYASPHAGAWWSGNWNDYSYPTYSALMGMTVSEPLSSVIPRNASVYYVTPPTNPYEIAHQFYADFFRNFSQAEVTAAYGGLFSYGYEMTAIMVSAPTYTSFLMQKFLKEGGSIVHENITALSYLTNKPKTDLVVNCPGLGALWLGDVQDTTVYPQRGQTLIMRQPAADRIYRARGPVDSSDPGNWGTYILPRVDGNIVVGGTRQDNNWNSTVSEQDSADIMRRATVMWPPIAQATLVANNVGFRPARQGGIRVELVNTFKVPVVHHYGHAGAGFEESWGSTAAAIKLVQTAFPNIPNDCAATVPNCPSSSVTSSASRLGPFSWLW